MIALDGFRLAMQKIFQPFELPADKEVLKAIIPGKVLNELSRILPDDEAARQLLTQRSYVGIVDGNTAASDIKRVKNKRSMLGI